MRSVVVPIAIFMLVSCGPSIPIPPQSQLETRQIQTREFPTPDEKLVMKAVLNALQDDGFTIKNAVSDLGLITASKELDDENRTAAFLGAVLAGPDASWRKMVVQEATVNVSTFGKETRVRVSLHQKVLDNRGGTISVDEIRDGMVYRQFFDKVDKSIFIQDEQL